MKDNSDTMFNLPADNIIEIGIDDQHRLFIKPEKQTYEFIYRAAAEVGWDKEERSLFSPKPREWTYLDWYKHITVITKEEYGCQLLITEKTQWFNISKELQDQICKL